MMPFVIPYKPTPEERAERFKDVDLRGVLRRAFILEDGLRDYLAEQCECYFMEYPEHSGRFALQSDDGFVLAHGVTMKILLDIAVQRRKAP